MPISLEIVVITSSEDSSLEDLPEAINDWEGWRERVMDIRADDDTLIFIFFSGVEP